MSYDFNCPYCSYGMNKDQVDVHEDDVIGEWVKSEYGINQLKLKPL